MFHATSLRHLMSQHIPPRTTIFYIWHHITPQSASHHHFTPPHLKAQHSTSHSHSPHRTIPHRTIQHPQLFHTTPTLTPQHISHHTIFHIAYHLILILDRHTTTSDITTHCIIFHIWRHTTITAHCICHSLHHHNSTPPHFTSPNFPHSALCNVPHNEAPQSTPRHIRHRIFCVSHHTRSENATFHIAPHFTSHHNSPLITPPHVSTPFHIMPTFHLAPHHAHRHIQI